MTTLDPRANQKRLPPVEVHQRQRSLWKPWVATARVYDLDREIVRTARCWTMERAEEEAMRLYKQLVEDRGGIARDIR